MPKLVIADVVRVPVRFEVTEDGRKVVHSLSLTCSRMVQDDIDAARTSDEKLSAFLSRVVIGWSDQRLVVEDDGTPSAFSAEALAVLLTLPGLSTVIFNGYMQRVGATAKN